MTPEDTPGLADVIARLDHIDEVLTGDPRNREDGGLLGDVRDLKRSWGSFIWWARLGGGAALTAGVSFIVARLVSGS